MIGIFYKNTDFVLDSHVIELRFALGARDRPISLKNVSCVESRVSDLSVKS